MGKSDPDFVRHAAMHEHRQTIIDEMADPDNPTPDELRALRDVNDLIADTTENL